MDGLVPFTIVVGTIFFCSGRCRIVPDLSWAHDPCLVFDGVEYLVDGEYELVKCSIGLKARSGFGIRIGNAFFL